MKPSLQGLAESYGGNLYTIAFNVCGNAHDAEDVVQDTFLAYLTAKKEFESEEHIRAWLIRVTINKAKNKVKTFWHRNAVSLEDYMAAAEFPSSQASDLFEAVMKLPEKYRIVIHLFYYEDYSVKEISEILRLSPGNVKVRLTRGREALRTALKEEWDND